MPNIPNDFLSGLDSSYAEAQAMSVNTAEPLAAAGGEPTPPPAPQEPPTLGGAFADTARGLAGGVEAAGRGLAQTAIGTTNAVLKAATPSFLRDLTPQIPDPYGAGGAAEHPLVEEPKYFVNKMAKEVTTLSLGMLGAGKMMPASASPFKDLVKQTAVGSFAVRDPHSERIANMIEGNPALSNPFTEWLQAKPEDSILDGKFKAALEDTLGVAVAAPLFKVLGLTYKAVKGKVFGKSVEEVSAELEAEVGKLAEAGDTLTAEKYPQNVAKDLTLDQSHPTNVLKSPDQIAEYKQVSLKDGTFATREADHMNTAGNNPIEPEKIQSIRDTLKRGETDKLPPVDMTTDPLTGEMRLLDGRHRVQAAKDEGFDTITARVLRDKNAKELVADLEAKRVGGKLPADQQLLADKALAQVKLEGKAGGAGPLAKAAEKMQRGREMFNLDETQWKDFQGRMLDNVGSGEMNDLFTKGLPEGAFNYSKMSNLGDVHATLQSLAEVLAPNLEKSLGKGPMTFQEMQSTAALFGTKPDVMIGHLRTWGVDGKQMPATLLAAKNWAQSLAADIFRDARSIAIAGSGGESAKIEMLRKVSVLADIEGMMKTVQTAAARTTAAGRIRTSPRYSGEQMLQMLDEAGGADKVIKLAEKLAMTEGRPDKALKLLRASWLRKAIDTHNELWINALLSGVSTHMVNVGTSFMNGIVKPGNIALGGAIRGDTQTMKEGFALWRAMGSHIKDSFEMSKMSWKIERPMLSITDKQLEIESTISAGNYGISPESWLGNATNWMGKAARMPSRFLGAEDEFFKQLSYRSHLTMQANREAMDMLHAGKLDLSTMVEREVGGKMVKMSEFDNFVADRFERGFEYESLPEFAKGKRASRGTDKAALQYANETTFTQSLKIPTIGDFPSIGELVYQTANRHPLLRGTILPFVKVPANLLREGFQYTPGINLLRKQFWNDLSQGGHKAAEATGKMATGGMLATAGVMLAVEGRITGAAPTDPDVRARMYEKGWQPYSIAVPNGDGTNTFIPFARFDPYAVPLSIIADFAQTSQHMNESTRNSYAAMLSLSLANLINSKGYLKGFVDAIDTISGGTGDQGVEKVSRVLRSYATSHIPSVVKTVNPDTEMKEVRSFADATLAKLPYFSQSVEAKRGYFGDKVMSPVGWPWHALLPTKPSTETSDPALTELARLADGAAGAKFGQMEKQLGTLNLTQFKNSNGQTAFDRMQEKLSESKFHDEVSALVQTHAYTSGTDGDGFYRIGSKVTDIKKIEQRFHKDALESTLDEFAKEYRAGKLPFDLRTMRDEDKSNRREMQRGGKHINPIERTLTEFAQ